MTSPHEGEQQQEVLVLVGAGAIGLAIARRLGAGKVVQLASVHEDRLQSDAASLESDGFQVSTYPVDVSSHESVRSLAQTAAGLGKVVQVVDTAGLSPVQASAEAILAVDLVGTAIFLEEFGHVIAPGGAGLVISSMAGHMMPALDPAQDHEASRGLPPMICCSCRSPQRPSTTPALRTRSPSAPTTSGYRRPPSPGVSTAPASTR